MASPIIDTLRSALLGIRDGAAGLLDELSSPYEARIARRRKAERKAVPAAAASGAAPTAPEGAPPWPSSPPRPPALDVLDEALNDPVPLASAPPRPPLRELGKRVLDAGGSVLPLVQVELRLRQLNALVRDYRAGKFLWNKVGAWIHDVAAFKDEFVKDVDAALAHLKTYEKLKFKRTVSPAPELPEILSPKDAAKFLGIDAPAVRRRIREEKLGAWKKNGSNLSITRAAFLRAHEGREPGEGDDRPAPPAAPASATGGPPPGGPARAGRRPRKGTAPPSRRGSGPDILDELFRAGPGRRGAKRPKIPPPPPPS